MPLRKSELEYILGHFGEIGGYEILPVTEVDGFQGTYYNLKISSNGQILSYFVKTIPEGSQIVNDFYRRSGTFLKEVGIYTKIFPKLNERKLAKLWPECHVGVEGRFLVLEDMKAAGWKMTKNYDFEHVKIALSGLANFHASSLFSENVTQFELLESSLLDETMFSNDANHPGRQMWDSFCQIADQILPQSDVSRVLQRVVGKVKPSTQFRNCLNHGDPWINNMFFKYDQNQPVDVIFVDFQSARYAPPALDLAIFAHIFGPDNADELAQIYYEKLELFLKSTQSALIPEAEFIESFEYYKETGISIAALYVFLTKLPEKYLSQILVSQDTFIPFALGCDYSLVLKAMEEDLTYRNEVVCALQRVVNHR